MSDFFRAFLKKHTEKWVDFFMADNTQNVADNQQPVTIKFINQERTKGVLPSGEIVNTIAFGSSYYDGMGYQIDGNVYAVYSSELKQTFIENVNFDPWVIHNTSGLKIQKGASVVPFDVDIWFADGILPPVNYFHDTKFGYNSKKILVMKRDISGDTATADIKAGQTLPPLNFYWSLIFGFNIDGGGLTGSSNSGGILDIDLSLTPDPPAAPAPPGFLFQVSDIAQYKFTNFCYLIGDTTTVICNIEKTRFVTWRNIPGTTKGTQNTNYNRLMITDLTGTPVVFMVQDGTRQELFTNGTPDSITFTGNRVEFIPNGVRPIRPMWTNKVFTQVTPAASPINYQFFEPYLAATGTPVFTPSTTQIIAFTDTDTIPLSTSPFTGSTRYVRPNTSSSYYTLNDLGTQVSRFTKNSNGSYTSKHFNIATVSGTIYDWTVIKK